MRVLLAVGRVGDLPARTALTSCAQGWRQGNPEVELLERPVSDGADDLLDAMEAQRGGRREVTTVVAPDAAREVAVVSLLSAGTAYLACQDVLSLATDPATATSYGVGQLVGAALDAGAHRVVLGAGVADLLDLGSGLLSALAGFPPVPFDPDRVREHLPELVRGARERVGGTELVLAAADTTAVRGLRGAGAALQPRVGAESAQQLERRVAPLLGDLLAETAPRTDLLGAGPGLAAGKGSRPEPPPGSGVGGGLGAAVLALGGRVVPGPLFLAAETGLGTATGQVDLAVSVTDRIDAVEAGDGLLGALALGASRAGVAVLALGRTGRLERRAGAPFGISATGQVDPDPAALARELAKQGRAWRW